jgi:hypothetical protein
MQAGAADGCVIKSRRRRVMKALSAAGAIAALLASPVLATPIDAVTIEAILGAAVGTAAIKAMMSDSTASMR